MLERGVDSRENKGCFIRRLRTQLILSNKRPAAVKALLINSGVYICHALRYPYVCVWAGELIRHSNQQSLQSRDTATFLEVCLARWVGALGITINF